MFSVDKKVSWIIFAMELLPSSYYLLPVFSLHAVWMVTTGTDVLWVFLFGVFVYLFVCFKFADQVFWNR